ncbi:MAG: phosphoenolpyruvate carboxykinase (ATP) [Actinomycetota bacterium]|nr:phosphoenolpyruvate carboxykinase (ATP) [Actinomycetota bacterium]
MASIQIPPRSAWRAMIESAFYANSVRKTTIPELYSLASKQPEVMTTSHPFHKPEQFGLPKDAKILISNDGGTMGRTARARRLVRQMDKKERDEYLKILSEAIYQLTRREGLWLEAIVGLHSSFMIKANLLSPVTDAKNMFDWGINFAPWMKPWVDLYKNSTLIEEPDILVIADPEWKDPRFPDGLVIIDEDENCAALLGLRYFGERKKGTLTLAWTIGTRQNMVACHGGIKTVGNKPPIAVFGLSGSGKSSLTNSHDHGGTLREDEKVTVIHDDAFLIDLDKDLSVALEPSLFDKTDAVKFNDPAISFFYSAQNVGVTETYGQRLMVCEDIRNDNGRCIKSRDMFNHADHCPRPGSVIWLQKDPSLPPVCKITDIGLAVGMGASLSTMRAKGVENVPAEELEKLVIEPFANPFRVHPLTVDCQQFRKLFKLGTDCYVMNTHAFGLPGKEINIPLQLSLSILTAIARGEIEWRDWAMFPGLQIPKNGADLFGEDYDRKYKPTRKTEYLQFLRRRMQDRITYLSNKRDIEQDMENTFIDPLVAARLALDKVLNPI